VTDFYDILKSKSKGYASMEYTLIDYRQNDLVLLCVCVSVSVSVSVSVCLSVCIYSNTH
jgi:GTP-binding protein LepA